MLNFGKSYCSPIMFEMSLSYHSMLFPLTVIKTDGKQTTNKPTKYKNKKVKTHQ